MAEACRSRSSWYPRLAEGRPSERRKWEIVGQASAFTGRTSTRTFRLKAFCLVCRPEKARHHCGGGARLAGARSPHENNRPAQIPKPLGSLIARRGLTFVQPETLSGIPHRSRYACFRTAPFAESPPACPRRVGVDLWRNPQNRGQPELEDFR